MHRSGVARGWMALGWLLPLGVAALYVYLSTTRTTELRPDPPAGFVETRPEWDLKRRQTEERLARAYWDCAARVLQWRYTFGSNLPEEPPPDFAIDAQKFPGVGAAEPGSRARYWQKLRRVWLLPNAWKKSYRWNPKWFLQWQ